MSIRKSIFLYGKRTGEATIHVASPAKAGHLDAV